MNTITPEFELLADEIARCIIKNLNKPKQPTNVIELHRRIHDHEEDSYVKNCTREVYNEPTGLI